VSTDVFTPAKRSEVMRAVKSANTKPELTIRDILWSRGFRYRLDARDLPGRPDIVFRGKRAAMFVHGCFWHGHGCARGARVPKTNRDYWQAKITRNVTRDKATLAALKAQDWRALVVWECQMKDRAALTRRLTRFLA
jgi:DNA mismatch endonuclease, patch repair protein